MRNLKTIEKKVRAVLEKNEDARNDDMVLYLALCNACLKDAGAMPLAEIMTQHKYLGLPSFESVSRTRRKLQARYPELVGSRPVQKMRQRPYAAASGNRRKGISEVCQRMRGVYGRRKTLQSEL